MARPIRVIFRFNGGSVMREASAEENEKAQQIQMGIWEKWKKEPGIRFLCYYLLPGIGHHMVFDVDDIEKLDAMDADMWQTKGMQLETYSFEIALGDTRFDEWWTS
jgi:hypothetical protein